MKKDVLLEIIEKLPANRREQLAAEIYQGLDAVDDDLNTAWIVRAHSLLQKYHDIPPSIPDDEDFTEAGGEQEEQIDDQEEPTDEDNDHESKTDVFDLVYELHVHCKLYVAVNDKREGIPSEVVFRELEERSNERDKQHRELFGDLEPLIGPSTDVTDVQTSDDFKLNLTFESGEKRIFDMKPYRRGMYSRLKDPDYFSWARVHWGGVHWPDGESLWAKLLYKKSEPVEE